MEMGMPAIYARQLLREDLTGLVVIAGKMNSGKTTTAGCVISERLIAYGGVAITAEDPIELPLEGQHGPGMCLQTHADKDRGGYETACTSIMRSGANIILLGEILSGEIAVEALRAGMNGHLILTTLHADDIQTCLRRLVSLVTHMYPPEAAQAIMADGLAAVVHQSLEGSPRRLANVAMLNVKGSCAAVNIVRSGRFELLSAEVDLQMARMIRSVRE
jgi:twitching motility protein PilT